MRYKLAAIEVCELVITLHTEEFSDDGDRIGLVLLLLWVRFPKVR